MREDPAMPHAPSGQRRLTVLNPLPLALHHYEKALVETLGDAKTVRVEHASIEVADQKRSAKLVNRARGALRLIVVGLRSEDLLILWPAYGLADAFFWRLIPGRGRRTILVHDPVPLRSQIGYSGVARTLGRWGARSRRVSLVAHTELAKRTLESVGLPVRAVVSHPVRSSERVRPSQARNVILVAGQFKSARDTSILEEISGTVGDQYELRIVGRGWPEIAGWRVDSRFLNEAELEEAIESAAAVLVPYKHYFQSGIAMRAFELSVPIVANRHEFIESLYGTAWPGFVNGDSGEHWWSAIERAIKSTPIDVNEHILKTQIQWEAYFKDSVS